MKHVLPIAVIAVVVILIVVGIFCLRNKPSVAAEPADSGRASADSLKELFRGEADTFVTAGGMDIDFFSIKHASIAVRAGEKWIYLDPVTNGAQPQTDYTTLPKADYIIVTHDHYDHYDSLAIEQLSTEATRLIANPSTIAAFGRGEALANGGSLTTAEGWTIEAVPAYNNSEDKLQFHPQGRDNGYVLTIDGFRIYVAGDVEVIPELSDIKDIDVAFLPCNLPFTMTPEQCAEAAGIVSPKVLFPYHYGETDLTRLTDLLEGSGIEVRVRLYQ